MGRRTQGWQWLLVTALASGCAWVGAGDRADRLGELDEDGDGVLAADEVQCGPDGDLSPNKFPGNPEVAYDGIDNDCQGGDLIDKDGDGYPGVTEETYLATLAGDGSAENPGVDPKEAEAWPTDTFVGKALDCLDDPGPGNSVNPGVVNDSAYDGIDADCGENNEFDVDGDGFIKSGTEAAFDAYIATYNYDFGAVAEGDCDDGDDTVFPFHEGTPPERGFPNAEFDAWYDGRDSDCGANNDFDADGDGFFPAEHAQAFEDYAAAYGAGTAWESDVPGDCWDSCDAAIALTTLPDTDSDGFVDFCAPPSGFRYPVAVLSSAVHEGIGNDEAYDGVDADCAGDNDFDQDLDAFSASAFGSVQVTEFLGWWGGDTLDVAYDDCDDLDPDVHPGQQEVLDGRDQDCFGAADSDKAAFRLYDGAVWTNLGQVEAARTDIHWALSVPADHVDWPLGPPGGSFDNLFLMYELEPGSVDPTVRAALINKTAVFPGNDLVVEDDQLHVGTTYATTSNSLSEWRFAWNAGFSSYDLVDFDVILFEQDFEPALDVSVLLLPSGETWTGGCGDGVIYGVENGGLGRSDVANGLAGATTCVTIDEGGGSPTFITCNTTDCEAYQFDSTEPLTAVLQQTVVPPEWSTGGFERIERYEDTLALVPGTGTGMTVRGAVDLPYFSGETVLAASATQFAGDSQTVAVAVVADTPTNRIVLAWDQGGPLIETELGFLDPGLNPQDVSLAIFGTELLVAATAKGPDDSDCSVACPDDDQVGWLLLNLQ